MTNKILNIKSWLDRKNKYEEQFAAVHGKFKGKVAYAITEAERIKDKKHFYLFKHYLLREKSNAEMSKIISVQIFGFSADLRNVYYNVGPVNYTVPINDFL